MFCPKCGAAVRSDDVFCSKCGVRLTDRQAASGTAFTDPAVDPTAPSLNATGLLVKGILSLAFALSGILAIVGLILSRSTAQDITEYYAMGGVPCGKVNTAKVLSSAAFPVGIVVLVITALTMTAILGIGGLISCLF
ncbi:MAG: zinc ribbon domain-containing protein [Clostridia bacterium]|nr:zinc ribbon domain-containing protein [Clostridia bacterium]